MESGGRLEVEALPEPSSGTLEPDSPELGLEELLELELELEELELLELLEGRLEELEELSSAVQPPVQPESPRARTRAAAVRRAADRFLFIRITRSSFRCLGP